MVNHRNLENYEDAHNISIGAMLLVKAYSNHSLSEKCISYYPYFEYRFRLRSLRRNPISSTIDGQINIITTSENSGMIIVT